MVADTVRGEGVGAAVQGGAVGGVDEVPDEDEGVVGARCEHAAARGRPLDGVDGRGVAAQLQHGLARLADVEDADDVAVGGEGSEEVEVMGGCYVGSVSRLDLDMHP